MLEAAGDFHEQPGLVFVLHACQPGKRVPVMTQRLVLSVPLQLLGVLQNQLALLGVAAFFVALHAQGGADLGPDLLHEVIVQVFGAGRSAIRLLLLAACACGKKHQGAKNENHPARFVRHMESLDRGASIWSRVEPKMAITASSWHLTR
jgi:hypothetical protein